MFLLFATRAGGVGLKNLLNKSHHDDAFNVKRISYQAEKKKFRDCAITPDSMPRKRTRCDVDQVSFALKEMSSCLGISRVFF